MSIAKRVVAAVEKMCGNDAEGATHDICRAVEATAKVESGAGGRANYKKFLHDNLGLITRIAWGTPFLNLNIAFTHPQIVGNSNGTCSIEEIIYHAVRCGLYHEACLPSNLKFIETKGIKCDEGRSLELPSSLIYGLIVAVVVATSNENESMATNYGLNVGRFQVPLNDLWGKKVELEAVLDADDALRNAFERLTRQQIS